MRHEAFKLFGTLAKIADFRIDRTEVSNAAYARFVEPTGYVRSAEKPADPAEFDIPVGQVPPKHLHPGSAVFIPPVNEADAAQGRQGSCEYVPGANWCYPGGPGGLEAEPREPVVHLSFTDMLREAQVEAHAEAVVKFLLEHSAKG